MAVYERQLMFVFAIAVLFGVVQSRAVNISNTWMLPEEGFPVFYRYFRDRISWYEADAVCQFHHANLVTADSSSQYDAIRAYLKELDITEKVWIGLSKTSEKPSYLWTDFRPLSGEGHWQEALPAGESQSLCAVMDPAADFLWRPLPCGGPEVAAFICELPIPSWALGPKGCLLTELPSLTVLYIPEQSALELTSDCGLDGTKRIACKGNADREEILKQLTCLISNEDMDEDKPTKTSTSDYYETSTSDENSLMSKTPKSWTFNTISADYGMPTRHRRETEDTLSPVSTKSSFKEVSTKDVSWQDIHREKTVLTTQHITALNDHVTPTPATNLNVHKTTDSSTSAESEPTLDSSVSDVSSVKSISNDKVIIGSKEQPRKTIPLDQKTTEILIEQLINLTTARPNTSAPPAASTKNVVHSLATEKASTEVREGTSSSTTQEGNIEEYPSAINQGQLFSIIENGTMFDIIELNETEQEPQNNKSQKPQLTNTTTITPVSIISSGKTTPNTAPIASTPKPETPTKKNLTKKPVEVTKKYSKVLQSKKGTPASDKATTQSIQSVNQLEESLTKEFEMMPDIRDSSVKLNRTFRKELPPINDENAGLETGSQFGIPRILNFTISNVLDTGEQRTQADEPRQMVNTTHAIIVLQNDKTTSDVTSAKKGDPKTDAVLELNDKTKIMTTPPAEKPNVDIKVNPTSHTDLKPEIKLDVSETLQIDDTSDENTATAKHNTKETSTIPIHNPIDPRIYMLNHHPNVPKNNESESIATMTTQSLTQESKVVKEEFLPKSLLGEKDLSAEPTQQTDEHTETSETYAMHPFPSDEPKKMNRHRNLHTTKQRKFYPYFFSRMLG